MNVVDSSGWLEYFADGPNAARFAEPLGNIDGLLVPSITLYEVFKVVCRQRGEDAALQAVAMMQQGRVIELSSSIALLAAKLSLDVKIPMADSIILATAQIHEAVLWTQDDIPFCKEGWLEPPLATYYTRRIERNDSNQSNP